MHQSGQTHKKLCKTLNINELRKGRLGGLS